MPSKTPHFSPFLSGTPFFAYFRRYFFSPPPCILSNSHNIFTHFSQPFSFAPQKRSGNKEEEKTTPKHVSYVNRMEKAIKSCKILRIKTTFLLPPPPLSLSARPIPLRVEVTASHCTALSAPATTGGIDIRGIATSLALARGEGSQFFDRVDTRSPPFWTAVTTTLVTRVFPGRVPRLIWMSRGGGGGGDELPSKVKKKPDIYILTHKKKKIKPRKKKTIWKETSIRST